MGGRTLFQKLGQYGVSIYETHFAALHEAGDLELLENGANPETLVVPGVSDEVVRGVVRRVAASEFKRHQSAPTLKLSSCTLAVDWQMPVASRAL